MGRAVLVTGPSVEPVDLDTVKTHLRISGNAEDTYLTGLIAAARRQVETYLGRALISQTWKMFFDEWEHEMVVSNPPLIDVTSVVYEDTASVSQTLATSSYNVITSMEPGRIRQAYSVSYPDLSVEPDAVTITYTAGYGTAATDVPQDIIHGILLTIGDLYAHRESVQYGSTMVMIPTVRNLLHPHKIYHF